MIKKLINDNILNSAPSKSVLSAAFVITVAGVASRMLGLLRDRFLAATFGAGDTLDAYYAAFRVPDLIYNLLILGALSAAFIPVFTGLISKEKEAAAWDMANGILNIAIFLIILLSVILAIFAPFLMQLITPGFSPEKMELTVALTRIMFFSPLLLGISGIFGGILTSFKRFLIYSLAPIMYNLGIIVGVLFFVKLWGPVGLAWGVALGAFLHMLIQYPAAKNLGYRHSWAFIQAFKNDEVRKVFTLMLPRVFGIAVSQVNLFVITIFASTLAAGSLAVFSFAQNLQSIPLGLFGISFAIAVFPALSALAAKEEKERFIQTFSETFRQVLFFVIPISIFILVLRAQIVRVVLGAGAFDWTDTILTYKVLGIFTLSLFAQSTIPLLARAFYALHDTKTPFYAALAAEAVNIGAVIVLIKSHAVIGLAMAFSLASVVQMILLLCILHHKFEKLDDKNIIVSVAKISLASFAAGATAQGIKNYLVGPLVDMNTFAGVFAQLVISLLAGASVFILMSHYLKLGEFFAFKNALTRKLFKEKQVITEDTSDVSGI